VYYSAKAGTRVASFLFARLASLLPVQERDAPRPRVPCASFALQCRASPAPATPSSSHLPRPPRSAVCGECAGAIDHLMARLVGRWLCGACRSPPRQPLRRPRPGALYATPSRGRPRGSFALASHDRRLCHVAVGIQAACRSSPRQPQPGVRALMLFSPRPAAALARTLPCVLHSQAQLASRGRLPWPLEAQHLN
jgi:hypothetical protein